VSLPHSLGVNTDRVDCIFPSAKTLSTYPKIIVAGLLARASLAAIIYTHKCARCPVRFSGKMCWTVEFAYTHVRVTALIQYGAANYSRVEGIFSIRPGLGNNNEKKINTRSS